MNHHLEAAVEMIRLLAGHIENSEGLMLNAGLINKRSEVADIARRLANKVEANALDQRSLWERIFGKD